MNFPGQKELRLLTPVRLGACGEGSGEARQDLPVSVLQGSSTCPTVVLQGVGNPFEHRSSSS